MCRAFLTCLPQSQCHSDLEHLLQMGRYSGWIRMGPRAMQRCGAVFLFCKLDLRRFTIPLGEDARGRVCNLHARNVGTSTTLPVNPPKIEDWRLLSELAMVGVGCMPSPAAQPAFPSLSCFFELRRKSLAGISQRHTMVVQIVGSRWSSCGEIEE